MSKALHIDDFIAELLKAVRDVKEELGLEPLRFDVLDREDEWWIGGTDD